VRCASSTRDLRVTVMSFVYTPADMRRTLILLVVAAVVAGCSDPAVSGSTSTDVPVVSLPATSLTAAATTSSSPNPTTTFPLADLSGELAWFAPLPPMPTGPGRQFIGSDDFMDLFTTDAPWQAAAHLQVFKLYGEWVAYHATPEQLADAVAWIQLHGLALAVEAGPLDPPADCGQGIEGFAGRDEGTLIANRISEAGGRIDVVALDEPYYYGSVYDGPNACHWDAAKVAAEVGEYIEVMRSSFPGIVVGDTEPTPMPTTPSTYTSWLESFRAVNGYDLGFLHLDIDWGREGWAADAAAIARFGEEFGVPIGIIYTGNQSDSSDDQWLAIAGERVKEYEGVAGSAPSHVLFQSWMDHPDRVLPETDPWTFTRMVLTYFEDHEALGFTEDQLAADLALGRPVEASATAPGSGTDRAVDGDPGTHWSAGDFAPQWIEITLDGPHEVAAIRLTPSQYPEGETAHRVLGLVDGGWVELGVVTGNTRDGIPLVVMGPWSDVERVRVETDSSPSWVAWYEIEVLAP